MSKEDMKITGVVVETKNYEMFKVLKGNREVSERHVNSIIKSMQKKGILITPILVNENMEIVDGQHRYEALKRLNQPIYFLKIDGYGIKECQAYNAVMKVWTTQHFIEGYANEGKEDYVILSEFMKQFPFLKQEMAFTLLTNMITGGGITKQAKAGEFKVHNLELATKIANQIKDIIDLMPSNINVKHFYMQKALRKMMLNDNYNHSRMIEKFSAVAGSFKNCAFERDYQDFFQDAYNRNMKKQVVKFF